MQLSELKSGESARILSVGGKGSLRQHFLDMGLIPGKTITYMKAAPMGDPIEYRIWGYELTLRLSDAENIRVERIEEKTCPASGEEAPAGTGQKNVKDRKGRSGTEHPGLGEMGKFHVKKEGAELDDRVLLTFGLAGNQNCGKTTLFNQLTGSNQHVGNFPGVTVDRKDGQIRKHENTLITDLPGIYSMSPYTSEEIVTREFFLEDRPRGIINIADATNLERNLYLTLQLIELDIPMVLALNMMDEVWDNGGTVHPSTSWRRLWEFRLFLFQLQRMKALKNWSTMRCMWQSIRNVRDGWISVTLTARTAARFTERFILLCILSRIMPARAACRFVLLPAS